ncbi:hypothetical protein NDA13_000332 [Ustilago tritici]|nr:hypothetical protein NDA13_000332 [Ustilago tritici]
MQRACPDCGSSDGLRFIADVGQEVCSKCGAVLDDLQIYNPTSAHDIAYSLGGSVDHRLPASSIQSLVGPSGRPLWSNTLEDSRRLNEYHRKPEVDARIQGTLATLGYSGLFSAVEFLFQRAREASWREAPAASSTDAIANAHDERVPSLLVPRRVKWGQASLLLATACCYAVLRREGVHVDIETVSEAAHQPTPKVKRSFRLLKLLVSDAVRHVKLANPDSYVHRILMFFHFHLVNRRSPVFGKAVAKFLEPLRSSTPQANSNPARSLLNTPFEAIETSAMDLCSFWWPKRSRFATVPQLAAFAIVVVAIESHLKSPAPIYEIFRYTHHALQFNPSDKGSKAVPQLSSEDLVSKTTIALHSEICRALRQEASKIPWLSGMMTITHRGHAKKSLKRVQKHTDTSMTSITDMVRRELLAHVLDILHVWRAVSAKIRQDNPKQEANEVSSQPKAAEAPTIQTLSSDDGASDSRDGEAGPDDELDKDELICFLATAPTAIRDGRDRDDIRISVSSQARDYAAIWPSIASRLQQAGVLEGPLAETHPIDLLSNEQVDQWLFDAKELDSLLRTDPTEIAMFERAKVAAGDWPAQSADERNAEFILLAKNIAQELASKENSSSSPRSVGRRGKKRPKHTTNPSEASHGVSSSHQSKRPRPLSPVPLREQKDESDWSD